MGESDLAGDRERSSARGTNEHRELHRPRGARGCAVAKRQKAKAAGHSDRKLPMREHCVSAPITHLRDERLSYSFG